MGYKSKNYSKFVATAATATLVATAIAPFASAATDVPASSPYASAIDFLATKGVNGFSDGTFKPQLNITRTDAAVMLVNVLGLDIESAPASGLTDVPARAVKHVNALKAAGITQGAGNGKFNAHANITRGELAVWIQKGFELTSESTTVAFQDVTGQYTKAVAALVENKVTFGKSATTFGTQANATRGEFAMFLQRADNALVEAKKTAEKLKAVEAAQVAIAALPTVEKLVLTDAAKVAEARALVAKAEELGGKVAEASLATLVALEKQVVVLEENSKKHVVESVKVINATEVEVKFNKAVSAKTVTAAAFEIVKNNGTKVAISSVEQAIQLSEDGRSAKIMLASALTNNDVLKISVKKDIILTSAYDKFEGATFEDLKFNDTVASKLVSSKAVDSTTIELTFDEPINWTSGSGISVNGATLVEGLNNTDAGNYTYTFNVPTLKVGANLVQLINVTDFAGNKEALKTISVDYVADNSIPEVSSVKAEDSNSFILTFNKSVDSIAATNFTIKKGNYTFASADLKVKYVDAKGNLTANKTKPADAADGTTPSKYVKVTVPTQASTSNPLYGTDESSVSLDVSLAGYKLENVLGKEYTGKVTVSKDLTGPKIVSSKLVTFNKANKTITIPFDKNLTLVDAKYITVMNGSVKEPITVDVDGKNLVITVTGGLSDAAYSVILDKGLVKDGSNNDNESSSLSVDVTTAADVKELAATAITADYIDNKNVITIKYGMKVEDSAAQAASYELNGSDLPEGSSVYFTDGNKDTVMIELPKSYTVAVNALSAKVTLKANAVKVTATGKHYGKVISSSATEAKALESVIALGDNVAPTITNVEFVKSTTGLATGLKVTFSENVDDSTLASTLVVKQGSTAIDYSLAATTATDLAHDNVLTLSFNNVTLSATGVILSTNTAEDTITLTDLSGNNKIGVIAGISAK